MTLLKTYRVPPNGAPQITKEFALNIFLLTGTSDASKATVVNGVAGCTEVRKSPFLKGRKDNLLNFFTVLGFKM